MITFGVTVDEEEQLKGWRACSHRMLDKDFWKTFDNLCSILSERRLTGNAALDTIEATLNVAPEKRHVIWAGRILNKDLRAGFQISTLNNVFPGTINPFEVALARPYDADKHEIRGAWCVEPKLDGLRMVVMDGKAYTRNGRTIDTVGHILKELEPLGNDYVFDGEIMGSTEFNKDSGKIRKKGAGENKTLVYNAFDCIFKKDWLTRKTGKYSDRRLFLWEALGTACPKYTNIVDSKKLPLNPTTEDLFALRDHFISQGYEGAMLKKLDAPYIWDRSDNILKLKELNDADGTITGFYEGKKRLVGMLGGFTTEFNGVETNVGGGYSDEQRVEFWKNRKLLVGKMIEVEYQNKQPSGALRNPVFIRFRPDRD